MAARNQAPCYLSHLPLSLPAVHLPMSSSISSFDHLSTGCHIYFFIHLFISYTIMSLLCIVFHIPVFLTSLIITSTVHCINHIPSLCFSISCSSKTPLSIALQAVDERTLPVMVEQRRSPDALDRPGPFISLVPDVVQHGETMPQGTSNIHSHQPRKQPGQRSLHLYLTDSVEVVLNSLSEEILPCISFSYNQR